MCQKKIRIVIPYSCITVPSPSGHRVYYHPIRSYLLMSSEVYEEFRLERDEFMLACFVRGSEENCKQRFKFVLDSGAPCYEAHITIPGYGIHNYLRIFLYFDPSLSIGTISQRNGASVVFSHIEDYVPLIRRFFIAPSEVQKSLDHVKIIGK